MKKQSLLIALIITLTILSSSHTYAQLGGLLQRAKDKVAQRAGEMMDGKKSSKTETTTSNRRHSVTTVFDFTSGDSLIFAEDFSTVPVGASVKSLKTNGAATVATVEDQSGKWLLMEQSATYRLTKQRFYPKHFTVEFDIVVAADKVGDVYPVVFGFTNDNSTKGYISQDGGHVTVQYYNNDKVAVSNNHGKYLTTDFDLTPYNNRPMHVSMMVDGERFALYLDKAKIADTEFFLPTDTKNLYISAPTQYSNGAKVLIGNLRIAGFKKI
ncbi:hypothetical protein HH214_12620 [Mucilaginibacter robiniae]|uniref:LamG domain-containing protein n=1 Tax=Mucilaginibacter robiniae TaxID=2728022 RepID=A0A7L5E2U5_9SPHI|nr:hypothetical protein [Mucilaginibacter robiniae]QJD96659.1 hypothetical protein HH214_12620 [Mucilaginibacter robiniae]